MDLRATDARNSSRYHAVRSAVFLGWWEEPEFRSTPARLLDLSHGGAQVLVGLEPPDGATLWLCLAGTPPGEWVEVKAVDREVLRKGERRLHLKFPESCPYELFEAAVLGIEAAP
jgi:hypothetical protein